jgi:hypothetical protein
LVGSAPAPGVPLERTLSNASRGNGKGNRRVRDSDKPRTRQEKGPRIISWNKKAPRSNNASKRAISDRSSGSIIEPAILCYAGSSNQRFSFELSVYSGSL